MPAGFTKNERKVIQGSLKRAALECLQRYGIRKTTVEQLTDMAGISKGAFYSFYDSKELLMFEVIDEYGRPMQKLLGERMQAARTAQEVADALYEMCLSMQSSFVIDLIKRNELDYLMRKLPEKAVSRSFNLDTVFIAQYMSGRLRPGIDTAAVVTGMTMLYSTMMHQDWYPQGQFEPALRLLVDAFIHHIVQDTPSGKHHGVSQ